ncbi:MAG: hypothetical protein KGI08_09115 [Thaumarchaeota archaeon]|nr:hypothetical protein [Nitrososphaerota archaeon]
MTQDVLQEYLVKLGYSVDAIGFRHFNQNLSTAGKRILNVGTAVAGVVSATAAATAAFAYSMRKMYFASELANSSVKNLKGMEYAGKQVGISNDAMGESLLHIGRALRGADPGLKSFINGLGITTEEGKQSNEVLIEFLETMKKMGNVGSKEFIGAQFAANLGMSPDDYHLAIEGLDNMKKKTKEAAEMYKSFGVDIDKAKDTTLEYTSSMDKLGMEFGILGDAMMMRFMPAMKDGTSVIENTLHWWTDWANGINDVGSALDGLSAKNFWGFLKDRYHAVVNSVSDNSLSSTGPKAPENKDITKIKSVAKSSANSVMDFFIKRGYASEDAAAIAANLHAESGLDSNANETLKGGGAGPGRGLAQWTSKERKEAFKKTYGVSIEDSTRDQQLDFVDKELHGTHKGAMEKMLAAHGVKDKAAMFSKYYERPQDVEGAANYRGDLAQDFYNLLPHQYDSAANQTVTVNNTFNVTGSDASKIADSIAQKQDRVNANTARNFKVMAK